MEEKEEKDGGKRMKEEEMDEGGQGSRINNKGVSVCGIAVLWDFLSGFHCEYSQVCLSDIFQKTAFIICKNKLRLF